MRRGGVSRLSHRIINAEQSERIAFHPAIEMPRNDHWISSQRISGVAITDFNISSTLPPAALEVHWVKPSKYLSSTPAW